MKTVNSDKPSTVTLSWEERDPGWSRLRMGSSLLGVRPFNLAREAGASLPARGSHDDLQASGLQLALLRGVWGLGRFA